MPKLMFDWDDAAAHVARRDKALGKVIRRLRDLRLEPRPLPSPFHALMRAIIYQQLSGKAAATIHGRLIDLSQAAARELGFEEQGLAQVHVTYMGLARLDDTPIHPGEERAYAMAQCVLPRPRALVC